MISARSIRQFVLVLGFGALCVLYLIWGVCDTLTDLGGDSATYMLMARRLSPFLLADPTVVGFAEHATYPPLFPAVIGLFGGSFAAAHGVVVGSLLLALVFLGFWLRAIGFGGWSGAVIALLFALMPGTYLLALKVWSENLYLCVSLLALLAAECAQAAEPEHQRQGWWWTVALAAAAATMIRTAGVPLAVTAAVFIAWRRPRRWPLMIFAIWVPFLAWVVWSRLHASGVTMYAQQLSGLYGKDALPHMFAQFASEVPVLTAAWLGGWMDESTPLPLRLVVGAFGCLCAGGCLARLAQLRFDAIYVVLYLLMLMLWPWPSEAPRLFYPVCPILIGHGFWACRLAGARISDDRLGHGLIYAAALMLGLTILPALMVSAKRRLHAVPDEMQLARYIPSYYVEQGENAVITALLINDLQRLGNFVPAEDCVFSIKPATVVLLANRRGRLPPSSTSDEEFYRLLSECRYAYLMVGQSATFPEPFYPRGRLPEGSQVVSALWNKAGSGELLAELIDLRPAQSR